METFGRDLKTVCSAGEGAGCHVGKMATPAAEKNRKMLGDVPNRPFFNLSIVYFYLIENAPFSGKATVLIRKSHMDTWNVKEEELYEAAYLNAPRLLTPKREKRKEVGDGSLQAELFEDMIPM